MVTMNNKEKYSEVYKTVEILNINMMILRKKSRQLYGWLYVWAILPAIVYCVFFLIAYKELISQKDTYIVVPLMVSYVVYLFCFYIVEKKYYRLRLLFDNVKSNCGELSDMVDWTTMRKRQIYNTTLDPKIQGAIDDFYEYTLSTSCPFYGGKVKYRMLRMISFSELISIMIYSLFVTSGVLPSK